MCRTLYVKIYDFSDCPRTGSNPAILIELQAILNDSFRQRAKKIITMHKKQEVLCILCRIVIK